MVTVLTEYIGVESVLNGRERNLGEWAHALNTSVVNEHVDATVRLDNSVNHSAHALIGLNIQLFQQKSVVVFQLRHARPRPTRRHHPALLLRERARKRVTYSSRGTSCDDNYGFWIMLIFHFFPSQHQKCM